MHWVFADDSTLVESVSGFVIHLMSGTWESVEDVIPETPDDDSLSILEQAKLLREGLRFASSDEECQIFSIFANHSASQGVGLSLR